MEDAAAEDGAPATMHVRARHIKKRALKNKSVSVSFNEKDLRDFVTGFHKRKKKRRKVARQQQEEAYRRKLIELRKQRKLERDYVMFGGAPPGSGTEGAESNEEDDDTEPMASVSGTTMYDNGDMQVTVTMSEIVPEEERHIDQPEPGKVQFDEALEKKRKQRIPVSKKKQFKKTSKKRSRSKPQSKRDKRKGKINNKRKL